MVRLWSASWWTGSSHLSAPVEAPATSGRPRNHFPKSCHTRHFALCRLSHGPQKTLETALLKLAPQRFFRIVLFPQAPTSIRRQRYLPHGFNCYMTGGCYCMHHVQRACWGHQYPCILCGLSLPAPPPFRGAPKEQGLQGGSPKANPSWDHAHNQVLTHCRAKVLPQTWVSASHQCPAPHPSLLNSPLWQILLPLSSIPPPPQR